MPLYHFHIAKGQKLVDPNTIELSNVEAAKHHAYKLAGSLTALSRGLGGLRHLRDWYVQVTDERGKVLARCEVRPMAGARE
jgi:hypothetical protein